MKNRVPTSVPHKVEVFAYSENDFDGILCQYSLLGLNYTYENKSIKKNPNGTLSAIFKLIGCRDERN